MLSLEEYHEAAIDSKCRMCYKAEEHIKRIVVGCTTLAPSEYTNRHKKMAGYIHWAICKHLGLQVTGKYYEHVRESIINVTVPLLCGIYQLSQFKQY
jgi:hypothetical protein